MILPQTIPAFLFQLFLTFVVYAFWCKRKYRSKSAYQAMLMGFRDHRGASVMYLIAFFIVVRCFAALSPLLRIFSQ